MRFLLFFFPLLLDAQPWTRTVCASGCDYSNLQTAIDAAQAYQDGTSCVTAILSLTAGETFTNNYVLPAKTCARYVHIRSSQVASLPAGVRVAPGQATLMAKVQAPVDSINSTIKTADASGTGYWALEGLEIVSPATNSNIQYTLLGLSESYVGENQPNLTPHHITVDRSYLHGVDNVDGPIRCIGAHGRNLVITNNYIDNCKYTGGDSQGIWMQNGPGPIDIINNFVEGAAENIMVGGAAPSSIPWLAVRNIRVVGNMLYKRRSWKYGSGTAVPSWPCVDTEQYQRTSPSQAYVCTAGTWGTTSTATNYWVKNIFELKEGQNVFLYGNILDGNWWDKQTGTNVLINQTDGRNYNVRNFYMKQNWVKTGQAAFGTGYFGTSTAVFTGPVLVENNLWTDISSALYGMNGNVSPQTFTLQTNARNRDYIFQYNTIVPPTSGMYYMKNLTQAIYDPEKFFGTFALRNNAIIPGQFLFNRDGYPNNGWCSWRTVMATPETLDMRKNYIIGTSGDYSQNASPDCPPYADFTTGYAFEASLASGFVSPGTNDWRINAGFAAAKGTSTDGIDLGADIDRIDWATAASTSGAANPYLTSEVRAVQPTTDGAVIQFTAPSTAACTLAVSANLNFSSPVGSSSQSRIGRSGSATITGLSSAAQYWVRLSCDGKMIYQQFATR